MALLKKYVTVQMDADGDVVAVWGPFETSEEAADWPAPNGTDPNSSFDVHGLFAAPEWSAADD